MSKGIVRIKKAWYSDYVRIKDVVYVLWCLDGDPHQNYLPFEYCSTQTVFYYLGYSIIGKMRCKAKYCLVIDYLSTLYCFFTRLQPFSFPRMIYCSIWFTLLSVFGSFYPLFATGNGIISPGLGSSCCAFKKESRIILAACLCSWLSDW